MLAIDFMVHDASVGMDKLQELLSDHQNCVVGQHLLPAHIQMLLCYCDVTSHSMLHQHIWVSQNCLRHMGPT